MQAEQCNILITSVGRRGYLVDYFKKALNGKGSVHVANSTALSPAFAAADACVVAPLIYDKDYISFILGYCKANQIKAVISLFDVDLPILAENKELFYSEGIKLLVSDSPVISICNDKWKSSCFLQTAGIMTPKTFLTLEDAMNSLKQGIINYPVVIKPRFGMGSIAIFEAENEDELCVLFQKSKRRVLETYLKYESAKDIEECVLIQEKIIGQEYGMDVVNDLNGSYQNVIVKLKYAMRSGETDCAMIVDEPQIKQIGMILGNSLGHIGNLDVDLFKNETGIYVLEMNARFGGGYPFSHLGGVDLPAAIVHWLLDERVEPELLQAKVGVVGHKDITVVELEGERKERKF